MLHQPLSPGWRTVGEVAWQGLRMSSALLGPQSSGPSTPDLGLWRSRYVRRRLNRRCVRMPGMGGFVEPGATLF